MNLFKLLTRYLHWCPRWLASVLVIGLALWLTLAPHPVGELDVPLFPGADKVVHACMFFGIAITLWWDAGRRGADWVASSVLTAGACTIGSLLLGVVIEWLQLTMGLGRSFEWADIGADAAGCVIAFFMIMRLKG